MNYEAFDQIIKEILHERERQEKKWGEQNHPPGTWNEILCEEIGEYNEAQLHRKFGGPKADNVRTELVQVAAVAIAMLECWDRNLMAGGTIAETGGIPEAVKHQLQEIIDEAGELNAQSMFQPDVKAALRFLGLKDPYEDG